MLDPYAPPSTLSSTSTPTPGRRLVVSTIALTVVSMGWVLILCLILPRMGALYHEVGRPLRGLSVLVFQPWFHVVVGGVMLGLIAWRYRQPGCWWITPVTVFWFAGGIHITVVGLFLPMMGLIEQVG